MLQDCGLNIQSVRLIRFVLPRLVLRECEHDSREKRDRQDKHARHSEILSQKSARRNDGLLAVEALTAGKPSFLEKISEIFLSSSAFVLCKTGPEEFIRPVHRQILFGIAVSALIVPPWHRRIFFPIQDQFYRPPNGFDARHPVGL